MNNNIYIRVYGTKKDSNTENMVFNCITVGDWNKRGKKNALLNGYTSFTFFTVACLENHFQSIKITI